MQRALFCTPHDLSRPRRKLARRSWAALRHMGRYRSRLMRAAGAPRAMTTRAHLEIARDVSGRLEWNMERAAYETRTVPDTCHRPSRRAAVYSIAFASCTRPAPSPFLRSSLYCVSRGTSTRATASSTALRTHAFPSFFPQVAALSQSASAAW